MMPEIANLHENISDKYHENAKSSFDDLLDQSNRTQVVLDPEKLFETHSETLLKNYFFTYILTMCEVTAETEGKSSMTLESVSL